MTRAFTILGGTTTQVRRNPPERRWLAELELPNETIRVYAATEADAIASAMERRDA